VTTVKGGEAFNVIPPSVEMQGTIRTFDPQVREKVQSRFTEIVQGVSEGMGCQAEIEINRLTPPLVNDLQVTRKVQSSVARILPADPLETDFCTMGSEDMAYFMEQVPGCYVFIGSANIAKGLDAPHHHPRFDIDGQVLPHAVALLAGAALDLLQG
jgi:amidohydrolase